MDAYYTRGPIIQTDGVLPIHREVSYISYHVLEDWDKKIINLFHFHI
jgi:hypothetical protein